MDSPPFQLLTRFDGLSPGSGLLFFLHRLHGASGWVLLHGRQGVDGVEEWCDFGIGGEFRAVAAQVLFQCDFEVDLFVALHAVARYVVSAMSWSAAMEL